ncbi:MAG: hypothetical protein L3K09_07270 [Thermoplasmata archaeon]|nr:hypothetical protein [Thermoplasmata archaeon]
MVDRHKTLIEFVTAWADYERRITGVALEAQQLAEHDPLLHQMIARIMGELSSSPDSQRQIALRLAIAEFSNSG